MKNKLIKIIKNLKENEDLKGSENLLLLSLTMLLLVFLIFMHDNGYLSIFMPVIIIPGLLIKKLRVNKYFWLLISLMGCTFYLVLDLVGYVPNHKHMFAYASLMVCIAMFIKTDISPLNFISHQSKYIIGLCFLFAVIGKFMAPEFLNGAFFEFTNTSDPRFFGFSSLVGDVDASLLKENEDNFTALLHTNTPTDYLTLNGADDISKFGLVISYWTIFIEGMIAISFCLPSRFLLAKYRNAFLVTFILTTYPIATVTGFAIILTTLGFIQSLNNNKLSLYSWFYLAVFILLPLNNFPFVRLLELF